MTQPQQSSIQSQSWPILLTLFEANLKKIVLSIIENHTFNYLICKLLNNLSIIIDPHKVHRAQLVDISCTSLLIWKFSCYLLISLAIYLLKRLFLAV